MRYMFAVIFWIMFALSLFMLYQDAHADWRWKDPKYKNKVVMTQWCDTLQCTKVAKEKAREYRVKKIRRYHKKKLKEWKHWTRLYIPTCIWYGESGRGPKYARHRYTMPNSAGSGAYGKFQFMPGTYHSVAKYHDWSPLDQEIAARREFWRHGTSPWSACR